VQRPLVVLFDQHRPDQSCDDFVVGEGARHDGEGMIVPDSPVGARPEVLNLRHRQDLEGLVAGEATPNPVIDRSAKQRRCSVPVALRAGARSLLPLNDRYRISRMSAVGREAKFA
jgi:hypothetical protein